MNRWSANWLVLGALLTVVVAGVANGWVTRAVGADDASLASAAIKVSAEAAVAPAAAKD